MSRHPKLKSNHSCIQGKDILDSALQHHLKGRLPEAEKEYRIILQAEPNHPEALHLLGVIAHQTGQYQKAVRLIYKAIENNPKNPKFHNNLGLAFEALNQVAKARQSYQQALRLDPNHADAYNNLGNTLKKEGQIDAAIEYYRKALLLTPDMPEAHLNLGKSMVDKGDLEAAIDHYQQAIRLKPDYEKAYNNLGNALKDQGQIEAAIESYQKALRLNPNYLGALNNLGNAYRAEAQIDEALQMFNRAINIDPESAESYCNLGNALKDQSRFEKALEKYRHAIRLKPNFAEAHFNCSMIHLLKGNFAEGWKEYEWRLQRKEWKTICAYRTALPRWKGESFRGKRLLVYDEQGFGDTLQFVRYLPLVKARGGKVIFETRKQLIDVFTNFEGIDELVARSSYEYPSKAADLYIPLLSLPGIFKTRLENIPAEIPYIYANPSKVDHWKGLIRAKGLSVGLVWQGTRTDPNRSCDLARFLPLAKIPGVYMYGLQKEIPQLSAELAKLPGEMNLINFGDDFGDFSDTAAAIANLDLVISIDTSVAHLAGAMGKPVWVLLPYVSDWRWLRNRKSSPWYPTMQLFRQKTRGDWDEVLQGMAKELQSLVENQGNSEKLSLTDNCADVYYTRGNRFYDQGNLDPAILAYQKALALKPDFFEAYFNLAKTFQDRGDHDQAIFSYQKALELKPDFAETYFNLGIVFQQKKSFDRAISCYQKSLELKPNFAEACCNMGTAFQNLGNLAQAISWHQKALKLKPDYAEAHYNLGRALYDQGSLEEAILWYKKALDIRADYAEAWHNLGLIFQDQGKFDEAIVCYQKTLKLKPDHLEAHLNMGNVFRDLDDFKSMILWYQKALQLKPDSAEAFHNLSVAYRSQNNFDKAIVCSQKALQIKPGFAEAFAYLAQLLQHACDWQRLKEVSDKLDELTLKSLQNEEKTAEQPMLSLRRHADPAINYAVAKSWSRDISKRMADYHRHFSFNDRNSAKRKITLGYLSNDFKNHVVMHLMSGLFGLHNKAEFNIFCYSHGKDDGSFYRKIIQRDCDKFIDLHHLDPYEAAKLIYADRVDILVDLMGHTKGNRLEICALRPAPVQVSYLGLLGTTGGDFMDYLISDKIVTPKEHSRYYSEKFVYLPHCYQVNDHSQQISPKDWEKKDAALPLDSFVFCSFNQPYKIEPVMFNCWMKILRQVPHGILWLLNQNKTAIKNLRGEAEARGVKPERLIFAEAMPLEEHLARLRLADLALDTRIYNGGATTSNALWVGVPVITLQGTHFVSRMSASSLTAIGLPELILQSLEAYEALAVRLACKPDELRAIRGRLKQNRLTKPLFDTPRFARNLEKAYKRMWEIFVSGAHPQPIEVVEN